MTPQEVGTLVGSLGFPIALFCALIFIFVKYVWPFIVSDQESRREAEAVRHKNYIGAYEQNGQALKLLTETFLKFSTMVESQHDAQTDGIERVVKVVGDNHAVVVKQLDRIESRIDPIVAATVGFRKRGE